MTIAKEVKASRRVALLERCIKCQVFKVFLKDVRKETPVEKPGENFHSMILCPKNTPVV